MNYVSTPASLITLRRNPSLAACVSTKLPKIAGLPEISRCFLLHSVTKQFCRTHHKHLIHSSESRKHSRWDCLPFSMTYASGCWNAKGSPRRKYNRKNIKRRTISLRGLALSKSRLTNSSAGVGVPLNMANQSHNV